MDFDNPQQDQVLTSSFLHLCSSNLCHETTLQRISLYSTWILISILTFSLPRCPFQLTQALPALLEHSYSKSILDSQFCSLSDSGTLYSVFLLFNSDIQHQTSLLNGCIPHTAWALTPSTWPCWHFFYYQPQCRHLMWLVPFNNKC